MNKIYISIFRMANFVWVAKDEWNRIQDRI